MIEDSLSEEVKFTKFKSVKEDTSMLFDQNFINFNII